MYRVEFSGRSIKSLKKLPKYIQQKTDSLVDLLVIDYRDSRLGTKKLRVEPL
jgi:mRNA-degrading endonuclease RelE of RelBE toxin-antitoxin system